MKRICHVCHKNYETVDRACWIECNHHLSGHRVCNLCIRKLDNAKIIVQGRRTSFASPLFVLIDPYTKDCPTAGLLAAVRITP